MQGRVLAAVGSTLRLYQLNTTQSFDGTGRTSRVHVRIDGDLMVSFLGCLI